MKAKAKSRVVTSRKKNQTTLQRILGSKFSLLVAAVVVGGIGTYLLALSHAAPPFCQDPLPHGKAGEKGKACMHYDPGPAGYNTPQRDQQVDSQLAAQAAKDASNPAASANADTDTLQPADLGSAGDLSSVSPNDWPCVGTGTDGYRTTTVYVYGRTNDFANKRPTLVSIAKRMNAVVYNSAVDSGSKRQIRFQTSADCHLTFYLRQVKDYTLSTIVNTLAASGLNLSSRKYVVWVDGNLVTGKDRNGNNIYACGITNSTSVDEQPGQGNANNVGPDYAVVWHKCWNYAEPHEYGHALGAVQPPYHSSTYNQNGAPRATAGAHCVDRHDVMCYNDGTAHAQPYSTPCDNTAKKFIYDCGHNDYFRATTPPSTWWLYSHWNIANSRFLTRPS
jgi:hypothetical protein